MTRRNLWRLGAAAMAFLPSATLAQQPIRLDRQMFVERTNTDLNGRARTLLQSAARVAPGDRLVVILNWRNEGAQILPRAILTNAVPRGARIDPSDPAMQVSVDGGRHWGRIADLWLPTPLGGERRALPEDVTHVRWTIDQPVTPGAGGRISFRATAR